MSPRLSLLVAFGIIGAALLVPLRLSSGPQETLAPPVNEMAPDATTVRSEPLVAAPAAKPLETPAMHLLLPTGGTVPVLNEAYGAPPLQWTDGRPWSPIVGTETDPHGNDWYVHGDGSRTITQIVYDRGKPVPATSVAHPVSVLPVADGSGKEDRRPKY